MAHAQRCYLALTAAAICSLASPAPAAAQDHHDHPDHHQHTHLIENLPRPDTDTAGTDADSPRATRRIVHVFDFDELDFNPDPVPRYWIRAQHDPPHRERPGFPLWNQPAFDTSAAYTGRSSVRLPVAGGSASLRLLPGAIPVFPLADYYVTAMIRTENLEHSRAFFTVRFLDQDHNPIPGPAARSAPIVSEGKWTRAAAELRGESPDAAFLQIDLELLQPREFRDSSTLGRHAVWGQDYDAAAWFDDVTVYQLPRVELAVASRAGVSHAPDPPTLRVTVRDMIREPLRSTVTVTDARGDTVDSASFPTDPSGRAAEWRPELPALGWYNALLSVESPDGAVGRGEVSFLWLPPRTQTAAAAAIPRSERARFGVIADDLSRKAVSLLPELVAAIHAGAATTTAWWRDDTGDQSPESIDDLAAALAPLADRAVDITLAINFIPGALADALPAEHDNPLMLGRRNPDVWIPYLLPLIDAYGQRIARWRIGAPRHARFMLDPGSAPAVAVVRERLARLAPGPIVGVPLPARAAFDEHQDDRTRDIGPETPLPTGDNAYDAVMIPVPFDLAPDHLRESIRAWLERPDARGVETTFVIEHRARDETLTPAQRAAHTARTAAEFWAALSDAPDGQDPPIRLALASPWRTADPDGPRLYPDPVLGVWRTLSDHLAGRRVVAEFPVNPGVRCFILADPYDPEGRMRRGAILAWNESAAPDDAVLNAYFGDGPVRTVDLFGNVTHLQPADGRTGLYSLQLTDEPVFIEGIDPYIAVFAASFSIQPEFLPSIITMHQRRLILRNPWPNTVSGEVQIVKPDTRSADSGWNISPSGRIPFTIPPGQTQQIPIAMSFSPVEEAGPLDAVAAVRLSADREYPVLRLRTRLVIGLEGLDIEATARRYPDENGPDLLVSAFITNTGDTPRTLNLEALAPATAWQSQPVTELLPGDTATRRFIFRGEADRLAGRRIRLSLSDIDSAARLNRYVHAPAP